MTSRERFIAAAGRRPVDRVPAAPYMGNFGAVQAGVPIGSYSHDGRKMAEAQIRAWELLGQDVAVAQSDNYYIAQGFGCRIEQPPDSTPHLVEPAVGSLEEIGRLRVPDPWQDGRMPVYLEAVARLREHFGEEVAVRGPGTGPFSLASYLAGGTEQFLMDVALAGAGDGERERRLLDLLHLAADGLIAFLLALLEAGSDVAQVGDSLASLSVISPATYERFVWPFERKVFAAVAPAARRRGAVTLLHICGDTTRILPLMAGTGADVLEIDHLVDIGAARGLTGGRVALMGNLDPTGVLLQGTPDGVTAAARACLRRFEEAGAGPEAGGGPETGAGKAAAGGFILGSGCEVPPRAPLENLRAMVAAVRGPDFL